jgi:hypothetical protein
MTQQPTGAAFRSGLVDNTLPGRADPASTLGLLTIATSSTSRNRLASTLKCRESPFRVTRPWRSSSATPSGSATCPAWSRRIMLLTFLLPADQLVIGREHEDGERLIGKADRQFCHSSLPCVFAEPRTRDERTGSEPERHRSKSRRYRALGQHQLPAWRQSLGHHAVIDGCGDR